jgi:hypothetical protein
MYVLFLVPCALHEGYSGPVGLGLHMHARLLIRLNLAGCGHSVVLSECEGRTSYIMNVLKSWRSTWVVDAPITNDACLI